MLRMTLPFQVLSLQLDGPVGVVEELLPATVTLMAQVDVNKWIVFRPNWFFDECHLRLFWSSAAFFDVTISTGTDNIFPDGFSTHAAGDNMVK